MKENYINYIPLKVYRRLRWERGQYMAYRRTMKHYGKEYARMCYAAEKAIFQDRPTNEILNLLKIRDDYILRNLEQKCASVIQKASEYSEKSGTQHNVDEPIWIFWWTGEENAPEIVKACIQSVRRNANRHKVVLLSKANICDYIALPEYIEQKHNKGIIGHAHYSDMVRLTLLSKYGGLWIDATVFISQPLPNMLFDKTFYGYRL